MSWDLNIRLDQLRTRLASEIKENEIVGRVIDIKFKTDVHGRRIMVWTIATDHGNIVIAYSQQYINVVVDNLIKMGFEKLSDVIGHTFKFRRIQLQKAKEQYTVPYPRFVPIEVIE